MRFTTNITKMQRKENGFIILSDRNRATEGLKRRISRPIPSGRVKAMSDTVISTYGTATADPCGKK